MTRLLSPEAEVVYQITIVVILTIKHLHLYTIETDLSSLMWWPTDNSQNRQ